MLFATSTRIDVVVHDNGRLQEKKQSSFHESCLGRSVNRIKFILRRVEA